MKRLLLVNKAYWPHLGGVETTVRDLAEGASKAGWEVLVLCLGKEDVEETINGVKVKRVAQAFQVGSAPISLRFLQAYEEEAGSADVIHFHCPNPMGEIAFLLKGQGRASVVLCTYHSDPIRPKWLVAFYGNLLRGFLDRCSVVVATSPNYVESSFWLSRYKDRCRIIASGVSVMRFKDAPIQSVEACENLLGDLKHPRVLFIGRLVYYKGIDFFLKAIAKVDGISGIVVGDGPLRSDAENLAAQLGLEGRVRFLRPLPDEIYAGMFKCADLFVLPSVERTEALGLVGIEAMASGLPVITTELQTGTSYYNMDGETGFVVEKANSQALAGAIKRILENPALKESMSRKASDMALQFSKQGMIQAYMELYEGKLEIEGEQG